MAKSTATSEHPQRGDHVSSRALALHLGLAGLLLTCFLVYDLGGRALWTDEEFSLAAGGENLQHAMFGDASHPPGYPLLLHYWLRARTAPDGHVTDGWLRAFSVPWALCTWGLGWLLACRLGMRREGLLAAWLMALSPLVSLYFRLGRYYSMTAALTMLCLYLTLLALSRPAWWRALLLGLAVAALGYTDYVALLIVALALALFGLSTLLRRAYRPLIALCGAAACAAILLLPLLLMARARAAAVAEIPADPLAASLWGTLVKLLLPLFALATGEAIDPWRFALTVPAVLITTLLLLCGLRAMCAAGTGGEDPPSALAAGYSSLRHERTLIALLWPANIIIATAIMSTVAANVPPNRVTSFATFTIPLAFLLLAAGLTSFTRRHAASPRLFPAPLFPRILLVALAALWLYALSNYFQRQQLLNPAFAPPWPQVATLIETRDAAGDLIVSAENAFIRYYHGPAQVGHDREFYGLADGSLSLDRRIWLIARDRGSQEMMALSMDLRAHLLKQSFSEQVFPIMSRTPREQQMLSKILRRPAWDAYVKVYLFTPPRR